MQHSLIAGMACLAAIIAGLALGANETQGGEAVAGRLPRWKDNSGMFFIRGGEFVRGGKHKVRVRSFYMDQCEVTNEQYCAFLNDGNQTYWNKDHEIEKKNGKFAPEEGKERRPVYCGTGHEAAAYAKWAGKRLPTEAEREWAAADREGRKYPWGNGIGIRCVRPARRVLVLLGENFEEIEFAAITGVLSWASHTNEEGDYMFPRGKGEKEVPLIEVVIAGFAPEVHGMGGMCIRPDVLVQDLKQEEVDRFDAVAIPACVGGARGRHTWKGAGDIESPASLNIVRRVHENGGVVAAMCAAISVLEKAGLPFIKPGNDVNSNVAFDQGMRTITCGGPRVATETVCLLLRALVEEDEYRSFRRYNPWLFGGKDEFAPRLDSVR